jgi:hypothetical protein
MSSLGQLGRSLELRGVAGLLLVLGSEGLASAADGKPPPPPPAARAEGATTPATARKTEVPPAVELDLGAGLGVHHRFGDGPAFPVTARTGLALGAIAELWPSPRWAITLGYEHADLGSERSGVGPGGNVHVERDLNTIWAGLRVAVLDLGPVGLSLALAPGLVWQSADATGTFVGAPGDPFVRTPFACGGSDSADLALRAGVGARIKLGDGLLLTADASLRGYRLTSEPLDECVNGAGTQTAFALVAGFAYRFDTGF